MIEPARSASFGAHRAQPSRPGSNGGAAGGTSALVSTLDRSAAVLRALGERYDLAPAYPRESIELLVGMDLHRVFAPPESGGPLYPDELAESGLLFEVLRRIGRADLSLGRIFEGHVNALKLIAWYGSDGIKRRLADELQLGKLFGVWATEPEPCQLRLGTNGAWNLEGRKSFATGAGGLDYAVITATTSAGEQQMVIVAANDPSRADLSCWRVRGMRATQSGIYALTGIPVAPTDILGHLNSYRREPWFTAGAWRFAAVQLGGIEGLLIEMRAAMSEAARSDPLQRAKFAEAVAATRTAYLWVREAASRAACNVEEAAPFALMTRGVVERAGLDVMELAARVVGTRSAFDGNRIDKIIRDLSLYLRQAGPDQARDGAAVAWLKRDAWGSEDPLW
jgi:alkylation response protein AidB-like acyl-CoA dehydrogenase